MALEVVDTATVKLWDKEVTDAVGGRNKYTMKIGWYGSRIKAHDKFAELGYLNEKDYWAKKEIGETTWYEMVRIAEAFIFCTEQEFFAMKIQNASALSRVPDEHRYDPEMLQKAAAESIKKFDATVAKYREHKEGIPQAEQKATFKLRMNRGQLEMISESLGEWMEERNLADQAEALVLLMAEYRDRFAARRFLGEMMQRVEMTVASYSRPEQSQELRGEIALLVSEMREGLAITLQVEAEERKKEALRRAEAARQAEEIRLGGREPNIVPLPKPEPAPEKAPEPAPRKPVEHETRLPVLLERELQVA